MALFNTGEPNSIGRTPQSTSRAQRNTRLLASIPHLYSQSVMWRCVVRSESPSVGLDDSHGLHADARPPAPYPSHHDTMRYGV
ncbi:hypothetical protein K505DRAFT_43781 [Melanomma pulvis-pyrius CBS 109.77]|uniref:Uncharacterized protein n=1 Tax=Melanomma pulvis-pyrius CBS 109.77 TaxID=1314802 RepID=A0A6A6XXJ0_9PLEO|nr:hypothetical protein K505DRAFT_43781 [Melanomma pulvis-pyrius CBS 109.77]